MLVSIGKILLVFAVTDAVIAGMVCLIELIKVIIRKTREWRRKR